MNKIQICINACFGALIIGLFVWLGIVSSSRETSSQECKTEVLSQSEQLPVAYINIDSLLTNYTFAQEANEKLMTKQEDARLQLNQKARSLQSDMGEFQRKLDNNAFLSRDRAEAEAQKLQKRQQDLQDLEAKLTQDIMLENQNLNIQLRDTLDNFLKEFNAGARYQVILANTQGDNILLAQPGYDITNEVVTALNERYSKKK
ncbi:MAG TPA: hypothetical protein DIW30_07365 [Bacteroidales bacterium]|nr:hypothetical protein [Bacteroidales bacterium]